VPDVERQRLLRDRGSGTLGILRLKPYQGVALAELSFSQPLLEAIEAFASAGKTLLLVCVPGNLAPERLEPFWDSARQTPIDAQQERARFVHSTDVPLPVARLESAVGQLLQLLQRVNLFKILAVEGTVDFDLLGLVLVFDVRFCGRTTVFENRILDRGATPGFGVLWYLTRHVGQPTAVDLVLNHPSLNAEEAQRLRLISHVSDDGAVAADAVHYAQGLGPSICRRAQDTGQGGHIRRVRL
jgi:hypothetical protein